MVMQAPSTINITPDEALQERIRREKARRHLVDFSEYVAPWYRAARHHRLAAEYLEQVEIYIRTKGASGIGRLLIFEPPRHGKTEQVSKHFPAWILGRMPDKRIILASYGESLATSNSRAVRELLTGDRYRPVFGELSTVDAPVQLSSDSRSVQAWDLASPHRGGLVAAGVGGGITGKGADLLIVDDPFKNREEAESEKRREMVWEWWTSSAYTRLEDGAAVIGMLTRWHGDDWAGRLLKAMASDPASDQYIVLNLPAIWENIEIPEDKDFETFKREKLLEGVWLNDFDPLDRRPGDALWPQKYNAEDLDRIQHNIGTYDFEALYQQSPYSRQGAMFKREWFAIIEAPPKREEIISRMWIWDKAGSQTGAGDYACGGVVTLTTDDLVIVENVVREQCTPHERDELMCSSMEADRRTGRPITAVWHQQDPGSAGLDSAQATNRMLSKIGFTAYFETVSGDKEVRAGPWSSALQGAQVRLVRGAWNDPFIEEHIAFPKGKFDDQVDMASWGYSKVNGRRGSGIFV